jgi:isopenicillin N synthase-like dioxygenase
MIPIIDLANLTPLGQACRETGFFYVTGHAIDTRKVFAAARAFFTQPDAAKQTLSIQRSPHNRGYVALNGERLDETSPPDRKEAFNIGLELPPDDPDLRAGKPFRGTNFWPDIPDWRQTMLDYYAACHNLVLHLHQGFAADLNLPADYFTPLFDRPISTLRLLRYPPNIPTPNAPTPNAHTPLGAGTHTDYGNLTILATDGIAGLQVQSRDGIWLDAPHIDGAFVCNIGDCLMRWTNDLYVSTPHRVISPTAERYSIAFFADPNPNALVQALPHNGPARYAPITAGNYLAMRLNATYDHRKAPPA